MAEKDIEEKDREKTVSAAQAKRDVVIMAERLALLYHAFVQAMAAELGEEKALAITDQAIAAMAKPAAAGPGPWWKKPAPPMTWPISIWALICPARAGKPRRRRRMTGIC